MATAAKEDAMDIDTASPEHEDFVQHMEDETLKQIVSSFLDTSSADTLEVQLRQHGLELLQNKDNGKSLEMFWRSVIQVVYHIVLFAEKENANDSNAEQTEASSQDAGSSTPLSRYKTVVPTLSHLRRLPVVLLEDILDVLSTEAAYSFWKNTVSAPDVSPLLFGKLLWHPAPAQHPCWLPFLKLSNKFLRRLQQNPDSVCAAADVLQTLSTVYPMSEKSATRVWGSHNTDHEVQVESEETYDEEKISIDTDSATAVNDYSFYETFWKLQHDLRNPNAIVVVDFLNRLKMVLNIFQSHPVSTESVPSSSSTNDMKDESTAPVETAESSSITEVSPQLLPFMSHSRLLSIQLTDPAMRRVVLTQFWIIAHHLMSQVPQLRVQLQSHLTVAESLLPADQLEFLQRSAVFQTSEPQWRQWKQKKCQPDLEQKHSSIKSPSAMQRKRKRDSATDKDEEKAYEWKGGRADVLSISQKMRREVPSAKDHLEDYVDALDPDAGIEAEYHPKNDAVFTWRALRLLAVDDLQDFSQIHSNGDFEAMVRDIYKKKHDVDIPGEAPAAPGDEFEEETKAEPQEEVAENGEKDEGDERAEKDEEVNDGDTGMTDAETKDDSSEKVADAETEEGSKSPKSEACAMEVEKDAESPKKVKVEADADVSQEKKAPEQLLKNGGTKKEKGDEEKKSKSVSPARKSRSRSPVAQSKEDGQGRRGIRNDSDRDYHSRSRPANNNFDSRRNYDGRGGYDRRDDRDRGDHRGGSDFGGGGRRGGPPRGRDDRRGDEMRRDEWRGERGGDRSGGDRNPRGIRGDRDERGDRGGGARGGRRGGGGGGRRH